MALETREHKLSLSEVLSTLVEDGWVAQADADALITERRINRSDSHPLLAIANKNLKSLLAPHKPLNIDVLTEWLAGHTGLSYFHIGPVEN